jgi:hypothetical protein
MKVMGDLYGIRAVGLAQQMLNMVALKSSMVWPRGGREMEWGSSYNAHTWGGGDRRRQVLTSS